MLGFNRESKPIFTPGNDKFFPLLMVIYGKGVVKLNFYTKYSVCMACTLTVFFIAAFILGSLIRANGYEIEAVKEEEGTIGTLESVEKIVLTEQKNEPVQAVEETEGKIYYDIPLSQEKQDYIFSLCEEYSLPADLVLAVMKAESNFTDGEISENNDWGIMQINSVNHEWLKKELGVSDILDFYDNTLCGVYMLSDYYHKYADINKIAMCYRYGEAGALKMWEQGIYETEYTGQIIRNIASLRY